MFHTPGLSSAGPREAEGQRSLSLPLRRAPGAGRRDRSGASHLARRRLGHLAPSPRSWQGPEPRCCDGSGYARVSRFGKDWSAWLCPCVPSRLGRDAAGCSGTCRALRVSQGATFRHLLIHLTGSEPTSMLVCKAEACVTRIGSCRRVNSPSSPPVPNQHYVHPGAP